MGGTLSCHNAGHKRSRRRRPNQLDYSVTIRLSEDRDTPDDVNFFTINDGCPFIHDRGGAVKSCVSVESQTTEATQAESHGPRPGATCSDMVLGGPGASDSDLVLGGPGASDSDLVLGGPGVTDSDPLLGGPEAAGSDLVLVRPGAGGRQVEDPRVEETASNCSVWGDGGGCGGPTLTTGDSLDTMSASSLQPLTTRPSNGHINRRSLMQDIKRSKSHDGSGSAWKFWRRFSTRARSERCIKADSRARDRPEITLLETPTETDQTPECLSDSQPHTGPLCGPLPDVVEKAPGPPRLVGPNGVAPPKPPRLFLYRTPSSVSKHSKSSCGTEPGNGEKTVDHVITSQPQGSPTHRLKAVENNNVPEQITRNTSDVCPRPAPASVSSTEDASSPLPDTDGQKAASTPGLLTAVASRKPKIKSPDLSSRRHQHGRSRRRSHDRTWAGGCSSEARARQRHIMTSISELLRQSLDPYPLLEPLKRAGVLTNVDVQSFLGHHDRKSVCEGLVHVVGDSGPQAINVFNDVLANAGTCSEILEVLQVMREMDRIVHDVAHAPQPLTSTTQDGVVEEEATPVASEEKSLRYEVGYLAPDHTLKPLVELERAQRLSKTSSSARNSAYSLLEASSEPGVFPGLVMMSVCVAGHNLSGPRAQALSAVLTERRCVCELRVGKTCLTGGDVAVLGAALRDNCTVHALDLRLNTVDSEGAEALAGLLHATRTLRELNLSSCGLSKDSLKTIAAAVGANRSLFDLDLSFLDVTDESAPCLRDMLRGNAGLRKLRLRSNNLTWSGCYTIAEGLTRSLGLQVLDLSRNTLGDAGMQALATFLPDTPITELYVENCGVTASGCGSLGEVVARCKRLKTLDASTNVLTDAGVSKLAAALERSSSIQNVGLNMCGVTNDGFSKLLDTLEKNTSVLQMKLCYNSLGETPPTNPQATSDNLRYRLRIVTSSRPKLKILLWGNAIDEG